MVHRFTKWVVIIYSTDWKCENCGMRVKNYNQMRQLEGEDCY